MESSSLFSLKYRLRKTDEAVEIVAHHTVEEGARSDGDWVSYIDSLGNEHIKEHLTLEWDFVMENPFEQGLLGGFGNTTLDFDAWESRRYDLVRQMVIEKGFSTKQAVVKADSVIAALKEPKKEQE